MSDYGGPIPPLACRIADDRGGIVLRGPRLLDVARLAGGRARAAPMGG